MNNKNHKNSIGKSELESDKKIGREEREHDRIRKQALNKAEHHHPASSEEYAYDWKLIQETEGLDDEEIVKDYAKAFTEDTKKGKR